MKYEKFSFFRKNFYHFFTFILVTMFAILCCVLFVSSIILNSWKLKAADITEKEKYYTSIEIQPGDSLWSIASEYMSEEYESVQEYIEDIKELNGMGTDEIHAGKFIIIPYYYH